MTRLLCVLFCASPLLAAPRSGKPVDPRQSSFTIHVGKAGLFAAAAHEHWVEAPVARGTIDDNPQNPSVSLLVHAADLTVTPRKDLNERDRAQVQSNMQTEVLESSKYPDITFQSTHIASSPDGGAQVTGNLTLHGVTRPIVLNVISENGRYTGSTRIAQTDFNIQPIKIAGGAVKVKNALDITFRITTH